MLIDIDNVLKEAPEVSGKKFSRGSTVNLDGFCSPYLFSERATCKCHKKYWTVNDLGKQCFICEAKVYKNDGMGKKTIEDYYILNITLFNMVSRSSSFFKNNRRISEEGELIDEDLFFSFKKLTSLETNNERALYLKDNVMQMKTTNKENIIKLIDKHIEDKTEGTLFTKCIPVINLKYRKDETGSIGELNKYYGALLTTVDTLNNSSINLDDTIDLILLGVQKQWVKINTFLTDMNILRNDFNPIVSMSFRAPLLPQDINLPFDGITIGWEFFKRVYKYQILGILRERYDETIKDALEIYEELHYGSGMLRQLVDIIKEDAVLMVNRVPSLTLRSLIAVKLNGITDSYTIQLPYIAYSYLSADNDGDTLSCFPLFSKESKEEALANIGVVSILKSITDFNNLKLDNNAVKGYHKYGAYLLEQDYQEKGLQ